MTVEWQRWVIFDRDTGGRKSIHVRSTPNSDRKFDAVVSVASCQLRTHALQKILLLHSSTMSARTRIISGMVIPRALAVLRFTTSSNLAGRSMGRSAGLVPPKIRPA